MSIEAKVAQAAVKVASEVSKQGGKSPLQNGESPFTTVLQEQQLKADAVNMDLRTILGTEPISHPADNAVSAEGLNIKISDVQQLDSVQSTDKIANMIGNLNQSGLRMEFISQKALFGDKMTSREMLAMQAMVHQASFEMQIGVQAMDAAKNMLQTLVQRSLS